MQVAQHGAVFFLELRHQLRQQLAGSIRGSGLT